LAIFFVESFAECLYDPTRQDVASGLFSSVFARQAQSGVLVEQEELKKHTTPGILPEFSARLTMIR
jgi:hypothetical protein